MHTKSLSEDRASRSLCDRLAHEKGIHGKNSPKSLDPVHRDAELSSVTAAILPRRGAVAELAHPEKMAGPELGNTKRPGDKMRSRSERTNVDKEDKEAPEAGASLLRSIGVFSEVGRLRKVFVHTPGPEVERMTPETASELLFNEIIHYSHVKRSHGELKAILGQVAEVMEVVDFLEDILGNDEVKVSLLQQLLRVGKCEELLPELLRLGRSELAEVLVTGLTLKRDTLTRYLSTGHFSLVPLPNMYFMRDSSMVIGNRNIASAMASPVRLSESIIMRALFQYHPRLVGKGLLLDGLAHRGDPEFTIEGGDVLVYSEDVLLIGLSERTTTKAVDALIDRLVQTRREDGRNETLTIFCVVLPRERSTIHLDMIFTFVSTLQAVIYAPYVNGRKRSRVVRIQVDADGGRKFKDVDDILVGLKGVGIRIDPIVCGGDNPLHQQREQWNSGANLFALAPGQVICYEMHENTVKACQEAGFAVYSAEEAIARPALLQSSQPIVVTMEGSELARGGGGPRCMTCPVLRDPIS